MASLFAWLLAGAIEDNGAKKEYDELGGKATLPFVLIDLLSFFEWFFIVSLLVLCATQFQ